MNTTFRAQTATPICASCGERGHARSSHRDCCNNPRRQVNQQGSSALTNPNAHSQNNASPVNVAAPINTNAIPTIPTEINEQSNIRNPIVNNINATPTAPTNRPRCRCGSSTHSRITHRECPLNSASEINSARQTTRLPGRHRLGEMNARCSHCSALMWVEEKSSGTIIQPNFTLCCSEGRHIAPPLRDTPEFIRQLLQGNDLNSRNFKKYIRGYNNAFSFTSLGVNLDNSLNQQGGPFCFRIHGGLYHRIGSVLPEPNRTPRFSQIYIYDRSLENQLNVRHSHITELNRNTLAMIQEIMYTLPNPYVNMYINMRRYIDMYPQVINEIKFILRGDNTPDRRRYNEATDDNEIAVLIIGNETDTAGDRDVVLRPLDGGNLQIISEKHRAYDSLGYPLMFPRGEDGWNINYHAVDGTDLTAKQLYNFRFMYRNNDNSLFLFGKLFHQYIVDMYAKIEQERLGYMVVNQTRIRAEQYRGLMDAVVANDTDLRSVGRRVILPSTFIGGPRHMQQLYQDAISIVSRHGKPDLFLTFTCNPNWPEIQSALLFEQNTADRPDLCARVFQMKLDCLMEDLLKKDILGKVVAHIRVIEFQKRGLPHAHILLILATEHKPRTTTDYDSIVSAEIPDPSVHNLAYLTVINNMMHGPCGEHNPNARCMENGRCTKRFPKNFVDETHTQNSGYPEYRRRNDGRSIIKNRVQLDNRWVVPHNIFLCTKYNAHINVEVCTTIAVVKYLYKYVYKGHDRARMYLEQNNDPSSSNNRPAVQVDEIRMFLDARYVSAPEACWRIFGFSLHREYPPHQRLAVHLPDTETVYFNETADLRQVLEHARNRRTTLQGWFLYNRLHPIARIHTYIEFPRHYVWNKPGQEWTARLSRENVIGRMYMVSPRQTERFFLRLLLLHVRGATSYEHLRTVNGVVHLAFQSACRALGLLQSDDEWDNCLNEAALYRMPYRLRQLFVTILVHCEPASPYQLWLNHRDNISEDYLIRQRPTVNTPLSELSYEQRDEAYNNSLLDIDDLLEAQGMRLLGFEGFSISPIDTRRNADDPLFGLTREEARQRQLIINAADAPDPSSLPFNDAQRHAFTTILEACYNEDRLQSIFFVDGPGGTGKTYLFNALLDAARQREHLAIAVASSGTASLLLSGGRTAHSTFGIPIEVRENTMCSITPGSPQANIIRDSRLIIWDEASMIRNDVLNCVDRTFRDILRAEDPVLGELPFGGKLLLFGGDFRQVLPVVPRGSRMDIISQCINQNHLWNHVHRLPLTENMRVNQALTENNPELARTLQHFSTFLLSIGNGTAPTINNGNYIRIPNEMILEVPALTELSRIVYNNFSTAADNSPLTLAGRAILAAKNTYVNDINNAMIAQFPGETFTYNSINTIVNQEDQLTFPVEYLNSVDISSLPPPQLRLKIGAPIMVLRNISFSEGVCNGTRLICTALDPNLIRAIVITGPTAGTTVFIPRIDLFSDPQQCGVLFKRHQFPIRLAFSMTINKAQGQTLDSVGLYLPDPVFGHGQLYVALSRAKKPADIKILLDRVASQFSNHEGLYTANIVYREVLQ